MYAINLVVGQLDMRCGMHTHHHFHPLAYSKHNDAQRKVHLDSMNMGIFRLFANPDNTETNIYFLTHRPTLKPAGTAVYRSIEAGYCGAFTVLIARRCVLRASQKSTYIRRTL